MSIIKWYKDNHKFWCPGKKINSAIIDKLINNKIWLRKDKNIGERIAFPTYNT